MSNTVAGRLAFVTGAGSGIGRAACKILAREGAIVIGADKNKDAAKETIYKLNNEFSDMKHSSVELDVTSSEGITKVLKGILEQYQKPPTIIVNSAGITKDNFIVKSSESDFQTVIDVNLKGTLMIMQQFGNAMIESQNKGSIINLASILGKVGYLGLCNYSASKAGVEAMTRVASKEFGKYGIRVNALLPGFVCTAMTDSVSKKDKQLYIAQCALKRTAEPEEIAEVITFLASDRSSYVNGASIEVSGG